MLTFPFTLFSSGYLNEFSTQFDGVDQYADTGIDLSGLTSFTIGGWFYRDDTSKRIDIGQSNNANSSRFKLLDNSDSKVYIVLSPASATVVNVTVGWKHIIAVYDGSGVGNTGRAKLYINGVLQTLTFLNTIPAVVPTIGDNNFLMGLDAGTSNYADGNFDEMVYFSNAVNQAGITELYNDREGFDLTSHQDYATLVSWWRMGDGDTHPTISDNKGSNDATMVNMSGADFVDNIPGPMITKYATFDGVDEYIEEDSHNPDLFNQSAYSVVTWSRKPNFSSIGAIVAQRLGADVPFTIKVNTSGYTLIEMKSSDGSGGTLQTLTPMSVDTWYMFAVTFDAAADFKTYENAVQEQTVLAATWSLEDIAQESHPVFIGAQTATGSMFEGDIKTVAFYNKALTVSELETLYNGGVHLNPATAGVTGLVENINPGDDMETDTSVVSKETTDGWTPSNMTIAANVSEA